MDLFYVKETVQQNNETVIRPRKIKQKNVFLIVNHVKNLASMNKNLCFLCIKSKIDVITKLQNFAQLML